MHIDIEAQPPELPHFICSPSLSMFRVNSPLYPQTCCTVSPSQFTAIFNSVSRGKIVFMASERDRFCVSLKCERDRYIHHDIPSLCSLHPPLPSAIGIGGVGVVVDVVVVVVMVASCQEASVGKAHTVGHSSHV